MKLFDGKIVWITGASSGIGECLVYSFIRKGATVIASSNESLELEKVKQNCGEFSDRVRCVPFDLSDTAGIDNIVKEQIEKTGRIDYLLNIGGISQRATIEETPLWLDRKIMEINYFGTIALTKAVLPFMIKQRSGHILATRAYQDDSVSHCVPHIPLQNRHCMGSLKHFILKIKNTTSDRLLLFQDG